MRLTEELPEPTTSPDNAKALENLAKTFHKTINRHGYGFQYAVLKHIHELAVSRRAPWIVEADEFPVSYHGGGTHIDFILRYLHSYEINPLRIVAECKRVNPALVDWCFVRSPEVPVSRFVGTNTRRVSVESVRVEYQEGVDSNGVRGRFPRWRYSGPALDLEWSSERVYNLAFPIKGQATGDAQGSDREKTLAGAVDQVLRGTAAFVEFLANEPHLLARSGDVAHGRVLPAVFTTARLWVSDVELMASDLESGNVVEGSLQPLDWLWLKQSVSAELRHTLASPPSRSTIPKELHDYIVQDYARAVAIISVSGIQSFLNNGEFGP